MHEVRRGDRESGSGMRVLNRRTVHGADNPIYIGRPTKWGNPFQIGRDGSRAEVIAKFEDHLRANPALVEAVRRELRGRNLACWCAPMPCHGDVLLRIANEEPS